MSQQEAQSIKARIARNEATLKASSLVPGLERVETVTRLSLSILALKHAINRDPFSDINAAALLHDDEAIRTILN